MPIKSKFKKNAKMRASICIDSLIVFSYDLLTLQLIHEVFYLKKIVWLFIKYSTTGYMYHIINIKF